MTETLNPHQWYPFGELMTHPQIRAAGDKIRCDASEPDWIDRFMGLCGLCEMAGPEETLNERLQEHEIGTPAQWEKFFRQGVMVFYSWGGQAWVDESALEPWSLTVEIGGESANFELRCTSEGHRFSFTDDDVTGMPEVMAILDKSYWRPINA